MACKTSCKLCPHLVISDAVTFANDTLTINIPAGSYAAGENIVWSLLRLCRTRPPSTPLWSLPSVQALPHTL